MAELEFLLGRAKLFFLLAYAVNYKLGGLKFCSSQYYTNIINNFFFFAKYIKNFFLGVGYSPGHHPLAPPWVIH